ncbi:MAG: uroporphyrinogen decarboxylase family protein [Crenarchaeota archaeon]|nr:uroporphyrinogen decarboxylase family protein [Thermoproteota archaeon]
MEPFDQAKYLNVLEENRRRVEKAAQFEEPDRVPVVIGLGGPYYAMLFGYTFAEYYNDMSIMLDAQVKGLKWRLRWLKDDLTGIGVHLDLGAVSEGIVFDCKIEMPDEENPWLSPWIIPRIKTLEDIDRLEVPDPHRHRGIQIYYERLEKFRELVRKNYEGLPVGGWLQIHPPVSAAGSLIGPEKLYKWLYEKPGEMHKLFRKLEEAFNVLQEYYYELSGSGPGNLGLADDHSGYLNRRMYEEFTMPYNLRLYQRHGINHRYLHMDSHMDHITDILVNVYRINEADVGVENNIKTIAEAFKGKVFFNGNADWRVLVNGSFENIELEVEKCIFHAAPDGGYVFDNGGETYVNVSPECLKHEVEYAKKVGRYPIRRENFKHLDKIKPSAY